MARRNRILLLMTAACLLSLNGTAQDNGRYLMSVRAGLLTFVEGKPTVTRPARGNHNGKMLEPGNRLETHDGDKVEIALGPENYLRVGEGTQVVAIQTGLDRIHFTIRTGRVILQAPHVKKSPFSLQLSTPCGDLVAVKSGRWRLEVTPSGGVEILALKGIADWVKGGQKIATLLQGSRYTLGDPASLEFQQTKLEHRKKDALDRWSDSRSETLLRRGIGPSVNAPAVRIGPN
jgi:hypothetical protein